MARKHRNKSLACPNCGTELRKEFEYCPRCGQENHDLRVPFKTFLYEFVESITHFDTKLWNTLKVIFTRPGQLTKDYVEGKRARYVQPARFYVFVSLVFFLVTSWDLRKDLDEKGNDRASVALGGEESPGERRSMLQDILKDSTAAALGWDGKELEHLAVSIPIDPPAYRLVADRLRTATDPPLDSLLANVGADTANGTKERLRRSLALLPAADSLDVPYRVSFRGKERYFMNRWMEQVLRRGHLTDMEVDSILELRGVTGKGFRKNIEMRSLRMDETGSERWLADILMRYSAYGMFALMPIAALLLSWHFGRGRFFWEHLIFSLHVHTTIFIFLVCISLVEALFPEITDAYEMPAFILESFGILVYLFLALRRVYAYTWHGTFFRLLFMSVPYFVFLVVTLLILPALAAFILPS